MSCRDRKFIKEKKSTWRHFMVINFKHQNKKIAHLDTAQKSENFLE